MFGHSSAFTEQYFCACYITWKDVFACPFILKMYFVVTKSNQKPFFVSFSFCASFSNNYLKINFMANLNIGKTCNFYSEIFVFFL